MPIRISAAPAIGAQAMPIFAPVPTLLDCVGSGAPNVGSAAPAAVKVGNRLLGIGGGSLVSSSRPSPPNGAPAGAVAAESGEVVAGDDVAWSAGLLVDP